MEYRYYFLAVRAADNGALELLDKAAEYGLPVAEYTPLARMLCDVYAEGDSLSPELVMALDHWFFHTRFAEYDKSQDSIDSPEQLLYHLFK